MERLDYIDQERVEYWRTYHATAAITEDTELDPLDRRSRPEVVPGTSLKRDDDVMLFDCIPVRIVGPGSGRMMACCMNTDAGWFGDQTMDFEITPGVVTDRAPADDEETPMPIYPE